MTHPTFTILMPIVRPPALMPFAVDSLLNQTRGDFELFIISDGAPAETVAAAETASREDSRIRMFSFPKGERLGEAHRHVALEHARGRYVCYLADDDLWFPGYLEEMAALLAEFEFGHLLHINITAEEVPFLAPADLADQAVRAKMMGEVFNFFGPSTAGHRMETYRRMPVGWSPAPQGFPTDLFMWRKFLALPGIAAGTRFAIAALHFPTDLRRDWPIERRREETGRYSERIASPSGRDRLCRQAWSGVAREYFARHEYMVSLQKYIVSLKDAIREEQAGAASLSADLALLRQDQAARQAEIDALRSSWSWRLTAPLRRLKD